MVTIVYIALMIITVYSVFLTKYIKLSLSKLAIPFLLNFSRIRARREVTILTAFALHFVMHLC